MCRFELGDPPIGRVAPISPWHLKSPQVRTQLLKDTTFYFQENEGTVSSSGVLWEAYKTVIRGSVLGSIAGLRKEKCAVATHLEEQILNLERQLLEHDSEDTRHNLKIKTTELSDLARDAAKTYHRATLSKLYDVGDKAGKLLAWLDKRSQAQRLVVEFTTDSGSHLTDPQDIADEFGRYYQQLYASSTPHTEEEAASLLSGIPLPTLTADEYTDLEADITEVEVEKAIRDLHTGKVSGPNGLPIELFQLVAAQIAPHLTAMYRECKTTGLLPEDQRTANIVVIHKEGKPQELCSAYRPISLLNNEIKILAKILVTRLLRIVTRLVHPDQFGFMPARNTSLNLRRLHGVMARASTIQEDTVIVSLDAASAFDTIEWPCMFAVLSKMGFGPEFLGWIRLLYHQPLARVMVNNRLSETFMLHRGTRQGCPLSPLLFALTLEPLAMWVRNDPLVRGMKWAPGWEDRISLYADDVLLYLASPAASLHRVLHIFRIFGRYAGYNINWSKSRLYVLSGTMPRLPPGLQLSVASEGFKYLGIWISKDTAQLYAKNLLPPLNRLRADITNWKSLPLTLLGRAALFKMMSLPRFLYALQNSPNAVPPSYFKLIDSALRDLLWENRPPRIATRKLTLGWYDGGIGLPDLKRYYWAAHLAAINQGTYRPHDDPAFQMDRWLLPGRCFSGALYSKPPKPPLTGPTAHAVQVWKSANKSLGWEGKITLATPLWYSDCLGCLIRTKGFSKWDLIGITKVGDLWKSGEVIPFRNLQSEYEMTITEHFRYCQIKHALYSALPKGSSPPQTSPLEDRILDGHLPDKTISLIYKKLLNNMTNPLISLREKWQRDVADMDDEEWLAAVASPREVAISSRLRLIQLKILHRSYLSRTRLAKMGYCPDTNCLRGCGREGTSVHTLWECSHIQLYWEEVVTTMEQVLAQTLDCNIKLALLNIWGPTDLNSKERTWITLGLMLAKRNIIRLWGIQTVPTVEDWRKDMDWSMVSEKSVYVARGCPRKWSQIWSRWNDYRGGICEPPDINFDHDEEL